MTPMTRSPKVNGDISSNSLTNLTKYLKGRLLSEVTEKELWAVKIIEDSRPSSLREFDQIPMRSLDLLCQAKLIAGNLAHKSIAFVGDHDSTSLLIGLLSMIGSIPAPKDMLLLDFDERLLTKAEFLAKEYGFGDNLRVQLYNVFDPVPKNLIEKYDWFYTNPPYGCRNCGESARLFITRGCQLVKQGNKSFGCIILPDDDSRAWTSLAMLVTQRFILSHGWSVLSKIDELHQYHLDDDKELSSSMIIIKRNKSEKYPKMPYFDRKVEFSEIPNFYGIGVKPPYPRYIHSDRTFNYNWANEENYVTKKD